YLGVDGNDFDRTNVAGFCEIHHPHICHDVFESLSVDDYSKQAVTLGFRYDLEPEYVAPPPPPPAPPPPPEPAKPRQFLVFFGFNKSNLTAEAENVVAEAAQTT